MVPKEFRKSLCVIAGWFTLLQALTWEITSIYSVGVYNCSWNFFNINKGANIWSMLYITYFMGSCEGGIGALVLGYMFTPPDESARILHFWMWAYIVLSAAWIPACILLSVAASAEVRGRQGALLYYPWIVLTSILVIVDFVAAVYHFLHILHTTTPDDFANFVDNTSWKVLTIDSPSDGITTWLPSLFMTLFFCRFLVIWLLNLFFVYGVYAGCNAVSLYTTRYLQSSLAPEEHKKTWQDKFYLGPDPSLFEQRQHRGTPNMEPKYLKEIRPKTQVTKQKENEEGQNSAVRYRTDKFGIPIEELRTNEAKDAASDHLEERGPRSPSRPTKSNSFRERRGESAPPLASGVQVPPELNKFEPFSYIAGDQPQRLRRPISRSNSRSEQPPIPHPDYTLADRRAASLEYVPNRFRVPSPKRPQSQSSFNLDLSGVNRPPSSPKIPPVPPKKPLVYPRTIQENSGEMPQQRYPSQQQSYYTRQASAQNNNYNINKLY